MTEIGEIQVVEAVAKTEVYFGEALTSTQPDGTFLVDFKPMEVGMAEVAEATRLYGRRGMRMLPLLSLASSALHQRAAGRTGGGLECPTCKKRGVVSRTGPSLYYCTPCKQSYRLRVHNGPVLIPVTL